MNVLKDVDSMSSAEVFAELAAIGEQVEAELLESTGSRSLDELGRFALKNYRQSKEEAGSVIFVHDLGYALRKLAEQPNKSIEDLIKLSFIQGAAYATGVLIDEIKYKPGDLDEQLLLALDSFNANNKADVDK